MTVPIKYLTCRFFQMDKNDVVKKILESKKYENLDSDIVEKVVSISEKKYKLKEVENYSKLTSYLSTLWMNSFFFGRTL